MPTVVDSGPLQGPPRLGYGGSSREAGTKAAAEEVADLQSGKRGLMGARPHVGVYIYIFMYKCKYIITELKISHC
jgi:hypothetical protein